MALGVVVAGSSNAKEWKQSANGYDNLQRDTITGLLTCSCGLSEELYGPKIKIMDPGAIQIREILGLRVNNSFDFFIYTT